MAQDDEFIRSMAAARRMMTGILGNDFPKAGEWRDDGIEQQQAKRSTLPGYEEVKKFLHTSAKDEDWASMVGNEEAIAQMRIAIESAYLQPELYEFYNMTPPAGILLWGPAGNGKTMMARIAAAMVHSLHPDDKSEGQCLIVNGPEIQSKWVGETENTIRHLYRYAREYRNKFHHPLVIFFDEADALFPDRNRSYRWEQSQVAELLTQMQGVKESGALTILATNRPYTIDEAVLRPGRIDVKIKVGRPRLKDVEEHLRRAHRLNPMICDEDYMPRVADYIVHPSKVVAEFMAAKGDEAIPVNVTLAHILSGAMCVTVFARAKSIAFRKDLKAGVRRGTGIALQDLYDAVDEIVLENKGLNHESAMVEIMDDLNAQEKEQKLKRMN